MTEELMAAMDEYHAAKYDYEERCEECKYDRGYFLHYELERIEKAKQQFEEIFNQAVRAIAVDVISKKDYLPV